MLNLDSIMINSAQPKVIAEFYKKVLDANPEWEQDDWYGFKVGGGSIAIGPHSEINGESIEPARVIFNLSSPDPKADFDRIKAIGATVIAEPYDVSDESGTMILSTFADPDGNYFQVTSIWEGPNS